MDWISVKDRLPEVYKDFEEDETEESEVVLVGNRSHIGLATLMIFEEITYWSLSYYIGTDITPDTITHWQPLPSPPKD